MTLKKGQDGTRHINKKIVQLDPAQSDVHEKLAEMNEQRSRAASSTGALPIEAPPVEEPAGSDAEEKP